MENKIKAATIILSIPILIWAAGSPTMADIRPVVRWGNIQKSTPISTVTPTPTSAPLSLDDTATASWYSQDNLIPARKAIANNIGYFGVAMHNLPMGSKYLVCLQAIPDRCIMVIQNDYCEGCETQFAGRKFDLQREGFMALSPLSAGVIKVVYKKL